MVEKTFILLLLNIHQGGLMFKTRSLLITVFSLTLIFSFIACEKKNETVPEKKQEVAAETTKVQEPEAPKVVIPDLKGNWSGKFEGRATTLSITEQDSTRFKGNITISYREKINQQVEGTFNYKEMKIKMKDLLHSRQMGTYSASLTEDMKMSGTFTMNSSGTKVNFNLTKKQ